MNRDPFLRLALLGLATAYAVGIWIVAVTFGVVAAAGATVLGAALAFGLTVELIPDDDTPRRSIRQGVTRRFGGPPLDDDTFDID